MVIIRFRSGNATRMGCYCASFYECHGGQNGAVQPPPPARIATAPGWRVPIFGLRQEGFEGALAIRAGRNCT